jgi:hypothetical protein
MAPPVFALVDCNNFYASCERVFQPRLEGRPVIVLSNNDGCVIARSNDYVESGQASNFRRLFKCHPFNARLTTIAFPVICAAYR